MIIRSYLVTLWAVLFVSCGPAVAQSVAVFDFELIDTSLEGAIRGARLDEQERLARLSDQLRQLLRDAGRFLLVDITPIASEAQASNLQACGGCDIQLARRMGAELAITGTVQKVSNLILNMNIYVRDASSGATIAAMSADMRGNTDVSWSRTLDWLVRNRLLAPDYMPRPAPYLSQKLTRPIPTKDGGTLRTVAEARAYMLGLPKSRELRSQWQHAAELLLGEADIGAFSKAVELALFYDAKLDVAKMPA
jgi:hypothetical protein